MGSLVHYIHNTVKYTGSSRTLKNILKHYIFWKNRNNSNFFYFMDVCIKIYIFFEELFKCISGVCRAQFLYYYNYRHSWHIFLMKIKRKALIFRDLMDFFSFSSSVYCGAHWELTTRETKTWEWVFVCVSQFAMFVPIYQFAVVFAFICQFLQRINGKNRPSLFGPNSVNFG